MFSSSEESESDSRDQGAQANDTSSSSSSESSSGENKRSNSKGEKHILKNTGKRFHIQSNSSRKSRTSSESNESESASGLSVDDDGEEDDFLAFVKPAKVYENGVAPNSNAEENQSDEDIFDVSDDGDDDINSFNYASKSPRPLPKQSPVLLPQNNEIKQVPIFTSKKPLINPPPLSQQQQRVTGWFEFQLPHFAPVDDSFYNNLLKTKYTDDVLLAYAKK